MRAVKETIDFLETHYDPKERIVVDIWSAEDFTETAEAMGVELDEQALGSAMAHMVKNHDATVGYNWHTVETAIEDALEWREKCGK